jgi:hypothetical protein
VARGLVPREPVTPSGNASLMLPTLGGGLDHLVSAL